jgi:hypothetical protein
VREAQVHDRWKGGQQRVEQIQRADFGHRRYAGERRPGEGFGDFLLRAGVVTQPRLLTVIPVETTT